ncbi:SDR family NAD(P)-dependent oxidoreductase [Amphritea balenae]|uniref:SDR family NAD(P)-dependent oxidoreductase n=1 Tax=Amphritea balenae TaxID=452629 RepID=A0A3P1SYX2_9GAMM|nr:SDR family NAD(P)-dependent oxidoreductase [Amphritea balenae]RRD01313.1 SDR family NAD(P)-dependent oxidoreductase [Amphritea balenae]GGK58249.1 oxidoreductase [Amphritea balenae]
MTKILITGATGAIGSALALSYACDGVVLHLHGRRKEALDALAQRCKDLGASVFCHSCDLLDTDAMSLWLAELDSLYPIDLFFANAGININTGAKSEGENPKEIEQLLGLNVKSTLLMSDQLAKAMRKRKRGQIVLVSSLAAYFGLPVTPSYSASKAAIKAYGEGLRGWLADTGVGVTVVMPGYVKSDMCDAMPGPKPFLLSADKAATLIKQGVKKNRAKVSFPFPLNLGTWFLMVLPSTISHRILKLLNYTGK